MPALIKALTDEYAYVPKKAAIALGNLVHPHTISAQSASTKRSRSTSEHSSSTGDREYSTLIQSPQLGKLSEKNDNFPK
jgi:vesicle coat complex subunit